MTGDLEDLIDEILVDAYGESEQLTAFDRLSKSLLAFRSLRASWAYRSTWSGSSSTVTSAMA